MKQLRWVWILGITAVLLIGIFIIVDMRSDKKEAEKRIGDPKQLFQFDGANATKVTVKNEEGVFSFRWNTEQYTWEQTEGDAFHVNSYVIAAMVNYASNLKSLKTVAFDCQDTSVYGFADPIRLDIYTTETGDSNPYTILIGDCTPTYDAYYAMVEGSNDVYTIDYNSGTVFCSSKNAMKNTYLFDTTATQVNYCKIERDGKVAMEIVRNSDLAWELVQPAGFSTAKAAMDELADTIVHETVDSFVEDNPKDLSVYGLDHPNTKIWLKGTNGPKELEEEIWIGDACSDHEYETNVYGYFVRTKQVFSITRASVAFSQNDISTLLIPYCIDVSIDDLDSVDLDMGELYDIKTTLTMDNAKEQFMLDDIDIDNIYDDSISSLYMTFYRSISFLRFSDIDLEGKPDPEKEPAIRIVYHFRDGSEKALTFVEKEKNVYYLLINGEYSKQTVRLINFTDSSCIVPCYNALVQALRTKGFDV